MYCASSSPIIFINIENGTVERQMHGTYFTSIFVLILSMSGAYLECSLTLATLNTFSAYGEVGGFLRDGKTEHTILV